MADSIALSGGAGNDANIAGLTWQIDKDDPLKQFRESELTGHLEFGLGYVQSRAPAQDNNAVSAIGATPVLRLESSDGITTPFVEGGIGVRFLSDTHISDTRTTSTAFQFGELIGGGVRFGPAQSMEVGVRLEHVSNGGIKKPNDGLTFAVLRLAYHYN
ncbi:MAG TPA: acyloxyacyl hydrolase [Burkholderiales bacterium]|nr:acyloxyacyl hydrolase [Burkholderiales bacterium]